MPAQPRTGRPRTARPAVQEDGPDLSLDAAVPYGLINEPPAEPEAKTITVSATDTETMTYPDVTELWAGHIALNGERAVVSEWSFMRATEVTFSRDKSLSEVRGWIYRDDEPFVYLVRAWRKPENRRAAQFEILGVARRETWTVVGTETD